MYLVTVTRYARKQIEKLPQRDYLNVLKHIDAFAENPRPYGYIQLKGEDAFRLRVGNYRIIYEINDSIITVTVIDVDHRKDVYR